MAKVIELDESLKFKATISFVLIIITGIIGFSTWMTVMQINTDANAASIENIEHNEKQTQEVIKSIDKKLAVIEEIVRDLRRDKRGRN